MARSYKKFGGFSDNDCRKVWQKRAANRKVRHTADVEDGMAYKRLYNPWKICDHNARIFTRRHVERWVSVYTWEPSSPKFVDISNVNTYKFYMK